MRIMLIGLNARYVHTNLAIRCLRESLKAKMPHESIRIMEFSINESLEKIAADIYEEKPDVVGFSCYIWNITLMTSLIRRLRPVLPRAFFLMGGPEVTYDPVDVLTTHRELDAVMICEGEKSLPELTTALSVGKPPWTVKGLVWRLREKHIEPGSLNEEIAPVGFMGSLIREQNDYIVSNVAEENLLDLNQLPNPYAESENLAGKLVYVETSRGCPFQCQFCISSTFRGVRFLEPEKFRSVLRQLFLHGARTVKFVDRTFNANKKHAFAILDIFKEEARAVMDLNDQAGPRAHCEMAGELLDEEWIDYLSNYPKGMIQLEIGVQSTHQPTLEAVRRRQNFAQWQDRIAYIQHACGIPVHLDLIAGLPYEGWNEFRRSFDDVYRVKPNHLQLGFLKVLKGSGIWKKRDDYGLVYSPDPPYSILQTRQLSHMELLALHRLEEMVETYVNSDRFHFTLDLILQNQDSAFDFFHAMANYWHKKQWFNRAWNVKDLFQNLWDFIKRNQNSGEKEALIDRYRTALRFDYYRMAKPGDIPTYLIGPKIVESGSPPSALMQLIEPEQESKIRETIRTSTKWQADIPELQKLDRRQWSRVSSIAYFTWDIPRLITGHDHQDDTGYKKDTLEGCLYLFYYGRNETKYYPLPLSMLEE